MSEKEPALTPAEWERDVPGVETQRGVFGAVVQAFQGEDAVLDRTLPARRIATAALALHGHPFGFTWEDVDALRMLARTFKGTDTDGSYHEGIAARAMSLAERIATLLPPRVP